MEDAVQATELALARLEEVEDGSEDEVLSRNLNAEVGGHLTDKGKDVKMPEGGARARVEGQQAGGPMPSVSKEASAAQPQEQ